MVLKMLAGVVVGLILGAVTAVAILQPFGSAPSPDVGWRLKFENENTFDCGALPEVIVFAARNNFDAVLATRGAIVGESAGKLSAKGFLRAESSTLKADLWLFERPGQSVRSISIDGNLAHVDGIGNWREMSINERKVLCKGTWTALRKAFSP